MKDKLTLPVLKALKPEAKEYFVWDTSLECFGVRVKPAGTISFLVQYRDPVSGSTRRQSLGIFGKPGHPTLQQAQDEAKRILAGVRLGHDPVGERRASRQELTVGDLVKEYLEEAEAGRILNRQRRPKSESTLSIDRGRINAHILPRLGKRRLSELTPQDVRVFMREIEAGRTATSKPSGKLRGRTVVKGGAGTARRTVGLLGGLLSYAVRQGYIERNPVHGVERSADGRRSLGDVAEIYGALGRALRLAEASGEDWRALALVRLIALTGMRRGEAVGLRWREVHRSSGTLALEVTKSGRSIRPIGRAALELLETLPSFGQGEYAFPAPRASGAPYASLPNAWPRIIKNPELDPADLTRLREVTLHHLRHAAATTAMELGLVAPIPSAILGHGIRGVTEQYQHVDRTIRNAADRLSEAIRRQLDGETATSAQVIRLS